MWTPPVGSALMPTDACLLPYWISFCSEAGTDTATRRVLMGQMLDWNTNKAACPEGNKGMKERNTAGNVRVGAGRRNIQNQSFRLLLGN